MTETGAGSIMVPLDGSPLSCRALEHAERLARALCVGIVLFTAVSGAERETLERSRRARTSPLRSPQMPIPGAWPSPVVPVREE
jgi:hypothetical protein